MMQVLIVSTLKQQCNTFKVLLDPLLVSVETT